MRALFLCACLAVLSLLAPAQTQAGKTVYELVQPAPPGEDWAGFAGIADNGECLLAAQRTNPKDPDDEPIRTFYRWDGRTYSSLKSIRRLPLVSVAAMSSTGKVVGVCYKRLNGRLLYDPVTWKKTRPREITIPRGERDLIPTSISPNGRVAGFSGTNRRPWSSKGKSFRWLDFPFAASGGIIEAINLHDEMVGNSVYEAPAGSRPCRWSSKGVEELPIPDGYEGGEALDINDQGDIVGGVGTFPGIGSKLPILWRNGSAIPIGSLGGDRGGATSINNKGQVVGFSRIAGDGAPDHGFLWTEAGGMMDLNDLLPPADQAEWEIFGAGHINNQGWLVVFADPRKGPRGAHNLLMRPVR